MILPGSLHTISDVGRIHFVLLTSDAKLSPWCVTSLCVFDNSGALHWSNGILRNETFKRIVE